LVICATASAGGNDQFVKMRDDLMTRMTFSQVAEAQWLAREWKPIMQPPR
jgi:hypothetical protein